MSNRSTKFGFHIYFSLGGRARSTPRVAGVVIDYEISETAVMSIRTDGELESTFRIALGVEMLDYAIEALQKAQKSYRAELAQNNLGVEHRSDSTDPKN